MTSDLFRAAQTTEKLQMLRREAEVARHLRQRATRLRLTLHLGGWQLTLTHRPVPA